jgi:cellobiose phosphorylase
VVDPCIPRAWPGFQIQFRYANDGDTHRVRVVLG